jgi:hypothetical protein
MMPIEATQPAAQAPAGMIRIPCTSEFAFEVHGIEIEGGDDIGVDVQYPGEDSPRRQAGYWPSFQSFRKLWSSAGW